MRRVNWTTTSLLGAAAVLLSGSVAAHPCRLGGPAPAGALTASWYGAEHRGRLTANGTPFDERGLTAAHPSLPLNSSIRVTNLANGTAVDVKVTDRGPGHGRGIDLSEGAAEALGMLRCGLATVMLTAAAH